MAQTTAAVDRASFKVETSTNGSTWTDISGQAATDDELGVCRVSGFDGCASVSSGEHSLASAHDEPALGLFRGMALKAMDFQDLPRSRKRRGKALAHRALQQAKNQDPRAAHRIPYVTDSIHIANDFSVLRREIQVF